MTRFARDDRCLLLYVECAPHSPSASFKTPQATTPPRPSRRPSNACAKPPTRGAQIVCLKELFNAPYFCKSQKCERFDLAEPIPGPTTDRMQALAKELAVVLIVPIFERQARGRLSQLGGDHRRRRIAARRVSQDAHPDDPLFNEKYYFTPGDAATDDRIDAIGQIAKQASGFRVWKTRYANIGVLICWDQWYPEAARITSLLGADISVLSHGDRLASRGEERVRHGAGRRVAHDAALARDRERRVRRVAESRRARGRAGHERHRVFRQLVHRRSVRATSSRSAGTEPEMLVATCDPRLIEDTRRNWPFLRDRRIDAYAPILEPLPRRASRRQPDGIYAFPPNSSRTRRRGSRGRITSRTGRASSSRFRGCTRRSCACCTSTSASRFSAMMKT